MNTRATLQRIIDRDGSNCWLCGKPVDLTLPPFDTWRASIDHVLERRNGGTNALANLKLAHSRCNSRRDDLFPATSHDPVKNSTRIPRRPSDQVGRARLLAWKRAHSERYAHKTVFICADCGWAIWTGIYRKRPDGVIVHAECPRDVPKKRA